MNKLTIYDDPDYGWTVEENSGYVHPCQNLDDALKQAKIVLTRYEPLNKVVEDRQAKCSVCREKGIHQPWCSAGQGFVNTSAT